MASDTLKKRFEEIEALAAAAGLDPYPICYFEVPSYKIYEVASYGLPTRYSHWSYGKFYQYQRTQGEMGYSKIYELILNNNPSYAFLDENNTETENLMIAAHCLGHSSFFKHNVMFKQCGEANMIQVSKQHADIIDQYRKDYGDDEVDEWIDVALALENHIDPHRGLNRKPYPVRHVEYQDRNISPWEDIVKSTTPIVQKVVKGLHIPPHPEKDILWFLSQYCNLEPWQKHIFEIVRRESYYFFPQYKTKIINEGFASFWHAELMHQYALGNDNDYGVKIENPLNNEEHLDFLCCHEKVVQPGAKIRLKIETDEVDEFGYKTGKKQKGWAPWIQEDPSIFSRATRLNPYYVGFCILRDIKKRWDEYYKQGYMEDEWGEKREVKITGNQKVLEVRNEEDDVSLLRNYLTEELVDELHLFNYGNNDKYSDTYGYQEVVNSKKTDKKNNKQEINVQQIENKTCQVNSKQLKDIINAFARSKSNYGVPSIVIRRVDESGLLRLEHSADDKYNVDIKYAEQVLKYVHKAWGRPVELIRKEKDATWVLTYDGFTFDVDYNAVDWPEIVEQADAHSAW